VTGQPSPIQSTIADQQPGARPPQPAGDQPGARLPTTVVAPKPRAVPQAEQDAAQPGDRICGSCGAPNDPSRKFCRRCGTSLVEAKVVAEPRLPWWKRLFGGGKKKSAPTYAAGERKSSMKKAAPRTSGIRGLLGKIGIVRGLLGLVVAIGIFGYVGIPSFRSMVTSAADPLLHGGPTQVIDNIRKIVSPKPAQVIPRPEDISATSELSGHEARLIRDGSTVTDWQGTDKVPEITVKFEEPIDLGWVIVRTGNSAAFADMRRPSALELVFPGGSTQRIDLEDTKEPQTFEVSASDIASLVIRVVDTNGPESTPISISEIEFFRRS
jgi:ribosomal protein L40E